MSSTDLSLRSTRAMPRHALFGRVAAAALLWLLGPLAGAGEAPTSPFPDLSGLSELGKLNDLSLRFSVPDLRGLSSLAASSHLVTPPSACTELGKPEDTGTELNRLVGQLATHISARVEPDDTRHNTDTVRALTEAQKAWHHFRDSHCWYEANHLFYPQGSRLWREQYEACVVALNCERMGYLEDQLDEYPK